MMISGLLAPLLTQASLFASSVVVTIVDFILADFASLLFVVAAAPLMLASCLLFEPANGR